jgi:hypothetical protein
MEKRQPRATDAAPAEAVATTPAPPPMYVPRGRTVSLAGRQFGPGTLLENLSLEDYAHLLSTGFLQAEPPNLDPLPAHNPAGVGFQNPGVHQGPVYS